ncbi:MAG: AtpZ/AtpI family protein [Armatimonadota bacterium]|nr:AtpZ/AtpI family protein [Armatimonadota bacterium]
MPHNGYKWMRGVGLAWSAGLVLVISTVIGLLIGRWLDHKFDTEPWLMLAFTVLGVVAGFVEMFKMLLEAIREGDDNSSNG